MRIISGYFKGKKIIEPKDKETRPLKDLTKESIFNIINHSNKFDVRLENSIVLDLFSGVGSFGLECLSRGAQHVTFVENYSGVLPILKKNLNNLKIKKKYEIIEKNLFDNLNLKFLEKKFDIIFLDPPYKENKLDLIIDNRNLLLMIFHLSQLLQLFFLVFFLKFYKKLQLTTFLHFLKLIRQCCFSFFLIFFQK